MVSHCIELGRQYSVDIYVRSPLTLQLDEGTKAKPKQFTYNVILGTEANQEDVIERSGNV